MIDPNDPGTLDLIAACEEPLSGAERARRHRLKKKQEKEAGHRAELDLKAPELALLGVALGEFRDRWKRVPSKLSAVEALLPRVPVPSIAQAFPGDSAWLSDAAQQGAAEWSAHSGYQADIGMRDLSVYRQTPHGQPEVDALVFPGDTVWTTYGTGPYLVKEVTRQSWKGLSCFSLSLCSVDSDRRRKQEADSWINEVVAVDGRLLKLFANNEDEVFIARRELSGGYVEEDEAAAVRAECRRIVAGNLASYEARMAGKVPAHATFDELVFKLLPFKDRTLLEWARRNEQLVRDTPADQAYPADPEKRNLLGQVLCDKHELNGRYQVLLEQAVELYELVDLAQHTPRMSSPAGFLREYKRHSESYAGHVSAGSEKWTTERFKTFGKRPAKPNEWQARAEKAETELAVRPGQLAEALAEAAHYREQREALQRENEKLIGCLADLQQLAESLGGPPMKMERDPMNQRELRRRIEALEEQNALEVADRAKAFEAVRVLTARLKKAGLPTDYRAQPGE